MLSAPRFCDPTEMLERKPTFTVADIIYLNPP